MSIVVNINGKDYQAKETQTIYEVCKENDIYIPTLCYAKLHDDRTINDPGSCRICVVEVVGRVTLVPSCSTPVMNGMVIKTATPRAIEARREVLELLLSNHPADCLACEKNLHCELQTLAAKMGVREIPYEGKRLDYEIDNSSYSIIRDMNKCVYCRRCETMCNEVQTIGVLSGMNRGFNAVVAPAFNNLMRDTNCTFCGQCVAVCPTASLTETHYIKEVWDAINDNNKHVVVQVAPSIRVSLGEEFGLEPGTNVTGKIVTALNELGFDDVFDTDFAADVTIMEEANEFVERLNNGGPLPILTSCCPGWINLLEHDYPDLLDIPSTVKSPQQIFGVITKTYYAKLKNIDPKDIVMVSIMPCLAKKYEANRPQMITDGIKDVDYVVSTRELAKMIKEAGINFNALEDQDFDNPLGFSSSAGDIFGASGGVLEAAVRTAYEIITGDTETVVEFNSIRGYEGVKEASIRVNDLDVNVAVTNGLGNARKVLEEVRNGTSKYHIIEIMACPGGCIGGGGQPIINGDSDILRKRIEATYAIDREKEVRKSNENPYVQELYKSFLGHPLSEKSHHYLHTSYETKKFHYEDE